MNNALVPVSDIEKMASAIAQSGFFGMKTKEQAMALMFIAQAEGRHPATAAQEYHVIQGKPALKADAMLARFQAAGGKVEWKSYTDKEVTGKFSHPQGGTVEISWTIEMATAAKLTGKETWKQYPRQMLRARVISEGIRTVYPGVAVGVYTPEEVQDFDNGGGNQMVDITPSETDANKPKSPFKNASLRNQFHKNCKESFNNARTTDELAEIQKLNASRFAEMEASGAEADQLSLDDLRQAYKIAHNRLVIATRETPGDDEPTFDPDEIDSMRQHEENIASGLAAKPGYEDLPAYLKR